MNITAEQRNALLHHKWGMFSPDGDLRVGETFLRLISTGEIPSDLWEFAQEIAREVASDGEWCSEAEDTVVREAILTQLLALRP